MKKAFYSLAIIAAAAVTFVSCKKDHTCKCSISVSLLGTTTTADSTYTITKSTKKNAEESCKNTGNALNTTVQLAGGSASCSLN